MSPPAQRGSTAMVRLSIQPSSCRRCTKAASHRPCVAGVAEPRYPTTGSCARAVNQCYDLVAAAEKKHIRPDYERSDPLLRKFGKCRVNFSLGAGIQDEEFDAQSLRGLLRIFYLRLKA